MRRNKRKFVTIVRSGNVIGLEYVTEPGFSYPGKFANKRKNMKDLEIAGAMKEQIEHPQLTTRQAYQIARDHLRENPDYYAGN